jgi:pimeloyl-ACP methyl ester carboxylesterase
VNGLNLYRANIPRRLTGSANPRSANPHTAVPVLVVRPTRDRFLTGVLNDELERICTDVRSVDVDAGHWVPRSHPGLVAELVREQIRHVTSA